MSVNLPKALALIGSILALVFLSVNLNGSSYVNESSNLKAVVSTHQLNGLKPSEIYLDFIDADDDDNYDEDDNDDYVEKSTSSTSTLSDLERGNDAREDDVLAQLLRALGDKISFPIIVGGIGDSGTRGIRSLLQAFRVQMLGDNHVNRQGDSHIFESTFSVFDPETKMWSERSPRFLYKLGVARAHSLQYNESHFSKRSWEFGRQYVGAMLWRTLTVSRNMRLKRGFPFKFWGMKHPRSMFVLPFISSALGNKLKFIHVLRDPKEVVSGDNQQMFTGECSRYYGRGKCSPSFEKRYEFWTDLDWDVYQVARRYLSNESYMMVRIEDFVKGDVKCFTRLAKFIGLSEKQMNRDMSRALNATTPHERTYFGHHISVPTRTQLYTALKVTPNRVKQFMEMVGYSTGSFQLTKSCLDLPGI